jgi:hypothetical protein
MAKFPRTGADIMELARLVASGLEQNPDAYPEPPVAPAELRAALERYREADHEVLAALGRLQQLYDAKRAALAEVVDLTKADLRYAEYTVRYDHVELIKLGWGGRRKRRRLQAPGQVLGFRIVRQDLDSVTLAWDKPVDGGPPAAYRIECSRDGRDTWREAGSTVHTNVTLHNQERGVQLAYRAIAINRAGEGMESAIDEAVL